MIADYFSPANHVHPEDPPNWVLDPQYTPDEQEKCQAFTPQDQLVSNDTGSLNQVV